jgi:hypothetical protein
LNDRQRAFVAAYIADPKHDAKKAAATAGYARPADSACKLMKSAEVVAEIEKWRDQLISSAVEVATLDRAATIEILERQIAKLLFIQKERAKAYAGETGGASGMIVKRVRYFGSGADVRAYEELVVDNTTNRELRETLKQHAIMTGDWVEKQERRTGKIIDPISEIYIEAIGVTLPNGAEE